MTISETSSVAYHQEERPAKRQRKTVKRAPAFCIAELGNMFMDNFALSDLGSFKSPKNVYPKVFYNEKPVTFKLNGAKLIKVRDLDKNGHQFITVAVGDQDVIADITVMCGEQYRSPLFGESGDLLGVELIMDREKMPFEIYNAKGKLLGSDLSVLEYGQMLNLKLMLNVSHSITKDEDGNWERTWFGFKSPQIKIVEDAPEGHKAGVCDL